MRLNFWGIFPTSGANYQFATYRRSGSTISQQILVWEKFGTQ